VSELAEPQEGAVDDLDSDRQSALYQFPSDLPKVNFAHTLTHSKVEK